MTPKKNGTLSLSADLNYGKHNKFATSLSTERFQQMIAQNVCTDVPQDPDLSKLHFKVKTACPHVEGMSGIHIHIHIYIRVGRFYPEMQF